MAVLTERLIEEGLREFDGNLAAIARKHGVTRGAVWAYVDRHDTLKPIVAEVKETAIDDIEGDLWRAARNGNVTAMIFILKTQGRHRGYTERVELSGENGGPVQFSVVFEQPKRGELDSGQPLIEGEIIEDKELTDSQSDFISR